MKKTILTFSCFFSLFLAVQAQIVITEIMYNPPESGVDSLEFIELLNNSNAAVNMTDWALEFGTFSFTIPILNLGAGQYQIFSVNSVALQNNFGKPSIQWANGALSNNGTSIRLKNNAGTLIDSLTFDDAAPWPTLPDGSGHSLVLCDPNSDNTLAANWQAASTPTGVTINGFPVFANPGAASGCPTTINAQPDFFNIFTGGQTDTLPVLGNDQIPGPNVVVTIAAAPQFGTASVNADNTIAYTPNSGYCGSDALIYSACIGLECDTALVTLAIPCYPQRSIFQMTSENGDGVADSVDVTCTLLGFVCGVNTRASTIGAQFTIIDANNSAGINVFSPTTTFGYTAKEGDLISVRGVIAQFNGLTEIIPHSLMKVSENNTLSAAIPVIKPEETTESRLIRINNLHFVDTAQWDTGLGAGFSVQAVSDDHPQDTILIRIDNDVNLFNEPVPPQPFNLTGIGGQFDATSPYTSGYQIAPRYIPDISSLVKAKEADFSAYVKLTPNPVSDQLLLQTEVQFERIRIFSATGALVKIIENPASSGQIPVSAFSAGVYFMMFEKDGAVWTTRFVKQ